MTKENWEKIKNNELIKREKERLLKIKEKDPELFREIIILSYKFSRMMKEDAE
ncbi:MAG: hypothetical protein J6U54_07775 [Clostridiales bacterium]|nr:hypothetical protein [Clostridiales bacterium]